MKEKWLALSDIDKVTYREWTDWDKKRHAHDLAIFQSRAEDDVDENNAETILSSDVHIPKKRKNVVADNLNSIPKKQK